MTIVEYVDGTVVSSWDDLAALSDTEVGSSSAALATVLAFVHPVDRRAVGLEKFNRPKEFVTGQVNLLARQWNRVKTDNLPDVAVVRAALADALPRCRTSNSGSSEKALPIAPCTAHREVVRFVPLRPHQSSCRWACAQSAKRREHTGDSAVQGFSVGIQRLPPRNSRRRRSRYGRRPWPACADVHFRGLPALS
jgi:hypothetical protein